MTMFLPWYSVGGWHSLAQGNGPVSEFNALTLRWDGSRWQFGAREWGFLLLGLASVVTALTVACSVAVSRRTGGRSWVLVLGVFATTLLVVALLEAYATPPFGDEPPLAYTWGAVVGVLAASVSVFGSWSGALVARRLIPSRV